MKKILIILMIFPLFAFSQSQNPPSIKWKQVTTDHFRVIFPTEIENYAKKTAIMMDSFYRADTKIFDSNHPKPVDLLLYNRSTISNAYAALAPRRMVWYLTPPSSPSLTLSPWNKTLGIHEYRHITQYSQMDGGFTSLGKAIFGQYGWSALSSWAYPNWYFEGDAVFNETIYSKSGRGRMPSFSLPLRTIYTNNQKISYEKALFRSYKTYYPNHYYLGYHMVTYINTHYGEDIWNKIIKRTNSFSFWPYSFERSVKKYTGDNVRKTYKKTFKELDSIWRNQISEIDTTKSIRVPAKKKRSWTNYFDPQLIGKDTLLVLKSGFDNNTTLCYLLNGTEKRIREIPSENISYAKGKVIWITYKENIRYGEESFNDIEILDLKSKKVKQITTKGKFASAEISHNADKIVSIKYDTDLIPQIVILDLTGKELYSFKGNQNEFFMMPTWTTNDKKIIFLKTDLNGESMIMLNLSNNEQTVLIEPQWIKFDKPICYDNYVLMNYDYTGITNIFALDINSKQLYQVTSKPYATSQAIVDKTNSKLYFTSYDLKGMSIEEMEYNSSNWNPIFNIKRNNIEYFKSSNTKESIQNVNTIYVDSKIDSLLTKDYKPGRHSFNVHSWSPMAVDQSLYGLELYSTDIMNTTNTTIGAYANIFTNSYFADATVDFRKYFPVFTLGFSAGRMARILDTDTDFESPNSNLWGYDSIAHWNQSSINFGVSIPLNLSKGIYYSQFNAGINASFISMTNISPEFETNLDFDYTQLFNYSANLSYSIRRYMNFRDIFPKFGTSINLNYSQVPRFFSLYGYRFYANSTVYLPGILNHHGIKLSANFEQMNKSGNSYYIYSSAVTMPRGYPQYYHDKALKLSADYGLPLVYPDFNIPYLLFVKRIRANIFYDYAQIYNFNASGKISSVGIDLNVDFNILRFNYMTFSSGVRISYLLNDKKWNYQFLFLDIPLNY